MAIDTASKRRAISGYSGLIIAPVADGAIGAGDRMQMAGLYPYGAGAYVPPDTAPGDGYGNWTRWGRPWKWFHWQRG